MRYAILFVALALAAPLSTVPAFAAGSGDSTPPTPTQTSKDCTKAQIWDEKSKTCIDAKDSRLDNDTRMQAVRELAWAGQPDRALEVLAAVTEGDTDRVLTYRAFALRKAGQIEAGLQGYAQALRVNPDNILARSYLGQLYVEMAELDLARGELNQIRLRGGTGTWAETSLAEAIRTGRTLSY